MDVKRERKVGKLRGEFGAIRQVFAPSFRKPHHHAHEVNHSTRICRSRYRFQAGVLNCQILNQIVESQLFTSLK
jgi:hypothetical protein